MFHKFYFCGTYTQSMLNTYTACSTCQISFVNDMLINSFSKCLTSFWTLVLCPEGIDCTIETGSLAVAPSNIKIDVGFQFARFAVRLPAALLRPGQLPAFFGRRDLSAGLPTASRPLFYRLPTEKSELRVVRCLF